MNNDLTTQQVAAEYYEARRLSLSLTDQICVLQNQRSAVQVRIADLEKRLTKTVGANLSTRALLVEEAVVIVDFHTGVRVVPVEKEK